MKTRMRAPQRAYAGVIAVLLIGLRPLACLCAGSGEAQSKWLDVPFVHQVGAGCGAASIAMVMQYWIRQVPHLDAVDANGDRIYRMLAPSPEQGIQGRALQRYLEEHGFAAFVFEGELQDLRHHLAKGRPVIVCLAPKGRRAPQHYVVVAGAGQKAVMLNDPARGKLVREDLGHFLRAWKATGNWALLAVPRRIP